MTFCLLVWISTIPVVAQRVWDADYLARKMNLEGLVENESKAALEVLPAKLDSLERYYQLDSADYPWLCLQVFRVLAITHVESYEAAADAAQRCLRTPSAQHNNFATRALLDLEANARHFSNRGMGERGSSILLRGLEMAAAAGDLQTEFDLSLLMANIYIRYERRDLAWDWIDRAREILPYINDPLNCHLYYVQVADAANPEQWTNNGKVQWPTQEEEAIAIGWIDKSIECGLEAYAQGHQLATDLGLSYHIRSFYWRKKKEKLFFYRKTIPYMKYKGPILQGEGYAELGASYLDAGIMDTALIYIDSSRTILSDFSFDRINVYRVYLRYWEYYKELTTQPDSAQKYKDLYNEVRAEGTPSKAISELELNRFRYQETRLELKNSEQGRELDARNARDQILVVILGGIAFVFLLVIGAYMRIRQRNKVIQGKNSEIESMLTSLQENLDEKILLVQEVKHRVKNNLQMITSFVDIQVQNVKQEETQAFAESIRKRIQAVNLIHELIVMEKGFARMQFSDYVQELLAELETLHYQGFPMNYHIQIPQLQFDQYISMQLGILLNELVSNSMKYAISEGKPLEIWIELIRDEKWLIFKYRDSGKGVPEEVFDQSRKKTTIGIRLIQGVIRQLEGTFDYNREGGGEYILRIPHPEKFDQEPAHS